jgi:DNA-binding PadR family transcriptional regulator
MSAFVKHLSMPRGRYLGEFELYVLAALARLDGRSYGMAIVREIESRTGRLVAIGAVYATLSRLERKGLVSFSVTDPLPVPGGRARKEARLTAAGRRALDRSAAMLGRILPLGRH